METTRPTLRLFLLLLLLSENTFAIDFVYVGDAGNANNTNGLGAVNYNYRIGQTEVTNTEYALFLNSVATTNGDPYQLLNSNNINHFRTGIYRSGSGTAQDPYVYVTKPNFADKPVNYVSWLDAARYVNWVNNGMGNGDTETGAYDLTGPTIPITHGAGAYVWLPTEDEWTKAAHFSMAGGIPYYWAYQTQSDTIPIMAIPDAQGNVVNPGPNVANYGFSFNWNDGEGFGNVSTVSGTQSPSYYNTHDQAGNVKEWIETDTVTGTDRVSIGGIFATVTPIYRQVSSMLLEGTTTGFRIAAASIRDGDISPSGTPDGVINAADLVAMQNIVMSNRAPTQQELSHGDLFPLAAPDGVIDMSDLILLRELVLAN